MYTIKYKITFEKSVPAATAAVRRVQRSLSPFSNSSRQRAVWAASSLDGASMTALGPFDRSTQLSAFPGLPFNLSEVLFAAFDAICSVEETSEGLERLVLDFKLFANAADLTTQVTVGFVGVDMQSSCQGREDALTGAFERLHLRDLEGE
ncbi:MAG: hypothetical protein FRX49_09862 [Trebouxia sp. A1-2]|nr:MAG: hypothetical protein FRX49_09862 [Trebouxia sp. A1-2]